MTPNKHPVRLLFFYVLSLFYMEGLLRLNLNGFDRFLSFDLFHSFLFSLVLALIFFLMTRLFRKRVNHILSITLLSITGFLFASQFVYFQFFRTFYSFYSAGNASQILEFRQDIGTILVNNIYWLLLFFLPSVLVFFLGSKLFSFDRLNALYRGLTISLILIFYIGGLSTIWFSGHEQNSAYDLYFETRDPILSVDRLGMFTTMRLDFQRLVTGWSPAQHVPVISVAEPDSSSDSDHEENSDQDGSDHNPEDDLSETALVEPEKEEINYNILDIDYEELIANETDDTIKQMHQYFSNVEPTAENDYTGKFEGYNLVFITAEGFAPYAIQELVTPTLYKMTDQGYNFTDFYVPLWDVSTSDGEYVSMTGLIPKSGLWSFSASADNELPFVMGNQLNRLGYETVGYHNHTYSYYDRDASHPNMGYDYKGIGNGLDLSGGWPRSDLEMMQKTIPEYIDKEPFHAYYMTISGHMQYSFAGNNIAYKNKELVEDLPYSEQAKAYLATQIELDKALEHLLEKLEEKQIADKTLIVLATDHYPYGLENKTIDEFAGHEVDRDFELYKSTLIIYVEGMEPVTIDKPSSHLDIIPTLSNLLGLEYDSRLLMGTDIFSESDPLVIFRNKSFITDKGKYNSRTREFISDEDVDSSYIDTVSQTVENKFYFSAKILETDYYRFLQ